MELEVFEDTVLAQLSDLDKQMLQSPKERWASLQLPSQLKSQACKKSAIRKKNKWSDKLNRTFSKGVSKQWQKQRQVTTDRPVPSSKKRKAPQDAPSGGKRRYWRGVRVTRSSAADAGLEALADSSYLGQQVRTVDDHLQTCYLNREWTVQEVRQSKSTGELHLRLVDERLAVGYATASQVVFVSEDANCTPAGPCQLNYKQFRRQQRQDVASQLSRDVEAAANGSLLLDSTLDWAVKEVECRLPTAGCLIVTSVEAAAIVNMDSQTSEQKQELALTISRLDAYSRVLVLLHSEAPMHYTLLQRVAVPGGGLQLKYWDSLQSPSASAYRMAQQFCNQVGWGGPVPPVCNGRRQPDGWSCGLYCLHFLEEAVREHRGEPVVRTPVLLSVLTARINKFIKAVQPHLPDSSSAGAGSTVGRSQDAVSATAVSAAAASLQDAAHNAVLVSSSAAAPDSDQQLPAKPVPPVCGSGLGPDVSQPEFTHEMAEAARAQCTKCRKKGCSQCMQGWFLPRTCVFWLWFLS